MKNFVKLIYEIITKVYNIIFTFIENKILKKSCLVNKNNSFSKNGYYTLRLKNLPLDYYNYKKIKKVNKYIDKFILSDSDIIKVIKSLFIDLKLSKFISSLTGFNYSIDYFIAYRTHRISSNDLDKGWYANHWHTDKPFTKNTLKIIIPLKKIINLHQGGLEILSVEDSIIYRKKKIIKKSYKMIGNINDVLVFNPNLCIHRAGEIKEDYSREQLMFQLNPSKNWCYNLDIKNKQYKLEPKFPFFSYLFDKKKLLLLENY
jgi:hypothetical protein